MTTREFGEVEFITREDSPEGYILRENESGVMLEHYYNAADEDDPDDIPDKRCQLLEEFPDTYLRCEEDLRRCLAVARKYAEDPKAPIFVEIWDAVETMDSCEFATNNGLINNDFDIESLENFEVDDEEDIDWDEILRQEIEYLAKRIQE